MRKPKSARARRQWGSDRRPNPLPMVPPKPTDRAITFGRLGIVLTVIAWLAYVITTVLREYIDHGVQGMRFMAESLSYVLVVSLLTFSSLMYLMARQGYLRRARDYQRVPRSEIDQFFGSSLPTLTVLVPSYKEDTRVVRTTLLSTALQEYPYMRIVLLLDDPPNPTDRESRDSLAASRALAAEIESMLAAPRERFQRTLESFEMISGRSEIASVADILQLAAEFNWAVQWLEGVAENEEIVDHVDEFFVAQVLRALAADFRLLQTALLSAAGDDAEMPTERLLQLYRRLAWTFRAELTSFERKSYESLSHEPNKAMNLNSYIGLMGGTFNVEETATGRILQPARGSGQVVIPDTDYILTLDADSVLLREYCLRLVHLLEQPENARVAVTQTPYSAFPGSRTRIERLAGASTDLQHIVHQGLTHYGATFWVGANAILRKRALEDIVEVERVAGVEVRRYVQDRTVIEDTESSIDMGIHGWSLVNFPERLSYSATPSDFGSLCIQRRRWADGGLLILPKLWKQARERRRRLEPGHFGEMMLRINYMASICWSSFGLLFMLAYPYNSRLLSPLVVLAAMPYFLSMAADLKHCGYKRTDVLRIYGFNLILLPVNLAGVLKSLQQAITNKKLPFARTPKVQERTTAAPLLVITPYLIVAFSLYTLWRDTNSHNWGNAAFAIFNALLTMYSIVSFIGLRNSVVDVCVGLVRRLYVSNPKSARTKVAKPAAAEPARFDWEAVLYDGVAPLPSGGAAEPAAIPTQGVRTQPTEIVLPTGGGSVPAAQIFSSGDAMAAFAQLVEALGPRASVVVNLEGDGVMVSVGQPAQPALWDGLDRRGVTR
jgi:cellulose synthase (UDP-forming)